MENSKDQLKGNVISSFILFMQHPVTTESTESRSQITESLHALLGLNVPVIMMWPNHDAGSDGMVQEIRKFIINNKNHQFNIFKNFKYSEFVNLMYHANCMVGNSSAGIRETPYLGTPVINIGTRENGREMGINVINVNYNRTEIMDAITRQLKQPKYSVEELYGVGNSGELIADKIENLDLGYIQKRITF